MSTPIQRVAGVGPKAEELLKTIGIACAEDLAVASIDQVVSVKGFAALRARRCITAARSLVGGESAGVSLPVGTQGNRTSVATRADESAAKSGGTDDQEKACAKSVKMSDKKKGRKKKGRKGKKDKHEKDKRKKDKRKKGKGKKNDDKKSGSKGKKGSKAEKSSSKKNKKKKDKGSNKAKKSGGKSSKKNKGDKSSKKKGKK
ncbi:MAG: hypothetical protein AAGF57_17295 [Pseudomonadota bacterium]